MKKARSRLTAAERKVAILQAVLPVFARKGFHATSTKDLARAAGVSEALIFKHFPDKVALYRAIMDTCCDAVESAPAVKEFLAMPASTKKLATGVHALMVWPGQSGEQFECVLRLMVADLLDNGDFARMDAAYFRKRWLGVLMDSIEAARKAGDLQPGTPKGEVPALLGYSLAFMLGQLKLQKKPVIDFAISNKELVRHAVEFTLRGGGVKQEAIEKHYDPDAVEQLMARAHGERGG